MPVATLDAGLVARKGQARPEQRSVVSLGGERECWTPVTIRLDDARLARLRGVAEAQGVPIQAILDRALDTLLATEAS